ncbi:MAG: MFS transporter [bacterium]
MLVAFFARRGIYYGWVVLATMFITMFMALGIRFSFGIFYVAILADTGWQRAETALIYSIMMLSYTIAIVPSGFLFDRFGPRVLFPVAPILLGAGLFLCSTIENILEFYLYYGVMVGVSFSLIGFPNHMAVVPRWFQRRRGMASGLALSGIGFGSLLISWLSEYLIEQVGWRAAFQYYGIAVIVVLVPLNLIFHRQSPQSIGLNPDGDPPSETTLQSASPGDGVTIWGALKNPAWWFLLISVSMIGFVTMTMVVHQTRLSMDFGYTLTTAAFFFGLTGIIRSLGQMTWGTLSDRFGRNPIFLLVTVMSVTGVLVLYLTQHSPHVVYLSLFTILLGFGFMGVSPVYASMVSELFQGRHLGKILAILDIGFGLGASSGPFLAGYFFDLYGNYNLTLILLIASICLGGMMMYLTTRLHSKPSN